MCPRVTNTYVFPLTTNVSLGVVYNVFSTLECKSCGLSDQWHITMEGEDGTPGSCESWGLTMCTMGEDTFHWQPTYRITITGDYLWGRCHNVSGDIRFCA